MVSMATIFYSIIQKYDLELYMSIRNNCIRKFIRNFKNNRGLYVVDNILPILIVWVCLFFIQLCPSFRHSRASFRPILGEVLYG